MLTVNTSESAPRKSVSPLLVRYLSCVVMLLSGCVTAPLSLERRVVKEAQQRAARVLRSDATPRERLVAAGIEQTDYTHTYDASYQKLDYPGGDVSPERGACTDVLIRAFRKAGVDLQREVHEDMRRNFAAYPKTWGADAPDRNIDHRRVPNLMVYFERKKKFLPPTTRGADYMPGDVVTWRVENGLPHTGLVTDVKSAAGNYMIVHNIGAGARIEDVLFAWRITGHYRYFTGDAESENTSQKH